MTTITGIGDVLRTAREQQGLEIADVASATRVRDTYLEALENEQFHVFGSDAYARGFLSTYARHLGLDPAPLLAMHREQGAPDASSPLSGPPRGIGFFEQRDQSWMAWALLAGAVVIGVVMVVGVFGGRTPAPSTPQSAPSPAAPSVIATPDPVVTAEPTPVEPEFAVDLILLFEGDSWVRIDVDGERVDAGTVVTAGASRSLQADTEIIIRFGDPGAVRGTLNGEDLGPIGQRGQPVTVRFTPDGPVVES